jgi:hypothetical protein
MAPTHLPNKTVSDVKNYLNTTRRKELILKTCMNVVTHLNLVDGQQFNDFNDLSHKMGMNHVMHMPTTNPLNLKDGQQFNDFNNIRHKMQSEKAPLEAKARVTNTRASASYKDSWMMEKKMPAACSIITTALVRILSWATATTL